MDGPRPAETGAAAAAAAAAALAEGAVPADGHLLIQDLEDCRVTM